MPAANGPPPHDVKRQSTFTRLARWTSVTAGRPGTFVFAVLVIVVWAATGPLFHYSDTWQLVINTSTTIVTFLMVFLIQATQNRDTAALNVKLDELIRAKKGARNSLINVNELSDEELDELQKHFAEVAARARKVPGGELAATEPAEQKKK
jgi:low affinity Fe/Cu permease